MLCFCFNQFGEIKSKSGKQCTLWDLCALSLCVHSKQGTQDLFYFIMLQPRSWTQKADSSSGVKSRASSCICLQSDCLRPSHCAGCNIPETKDQQLSISPYSEHSSLSIINMHMWMCLNAFIHLHKSTQDTQLPNVFTYNEHLPRYTAGLKQDQAGDYVEQ